jgi:hypothetical protein
VLGDGDFTLTPSGGASLPLALGLVGLAAAAGLAAGLKSRRPARP